MFRLIAAFALTLAWVPVVAAECRAYKARDFDITLVMDDRSLTVSWERYSEKLDLVTTKPWGVLQEAAVDMDEPGQPEHYIMREKIGGKDALIFDSIVFFPSCK